MMISRAVSVVCLLTGLAGSAAFGLDEGKAASNVSRLRVRAQPDVESDVRGYLAKEEEVSLVEKSSFTATVNGHEDFWYKISSKAGVKGWVFGEYIRLPGQAKKEPEPPPPPKLPAKPPPAPETATAPPLAAPLLDIREFEFDEARLVKRALEELQKAAGPTALSVYDAEHPTFNSYIGSECDMAPRRVVVVTFKERQGPGYGNVQMDVSGGGRPRSSQFVATLDGPASLVGPIRDPAKFGGCGQE